MPDRANWTEENPLYDDSQTQFDPSSRIHKHNSTEPANSGPSGDSGKSLPLDSDELPSKLDRLIQREYTAARRPLSVRGDIPLRPELLDRDTGEAVDWSTAVSRYRQWLDGYTGDDSGALLLEDEDGEEHEKPANVRFGEHRAKKEYARLHNLHDGLEHEYDNLHIAFLSFTASMRNDRGGLRCPADHLADVDASRDAVMESLRRQLPNRRYETAWILEPHSPDSGSAETAGYVHRHLVVFVEGAVPRSTFEPLIDSHLNNSVPARKPAHRYDDCIDVKPVDRTGDDSDDTVNSIAYYLTEYITDSFDSTQKTPKHVEKFNALLWATGKRRVGYSQGAYDYMETGYELHTGNEFDDSPTGWNLVGYVDEDGEIHRLTSLEPEDRGVTYVSPTSLSPQLLDPRGDPPPDDSTEAVDEGYQRET
jgi:hypothetical protein